MIKDDVIKKWFLDNKDNLNCEAVKIFNVDYVHLKLNNGDDLYVTKFGMPVLENLLPENHIGDLEWHKTNSVKLSGTSCLYKVKTKPVKGVAIDIVIKWNRMGQDVPISDDIADDNEYIEFNSPFEEFSLVMELKSIMDQNGLIFIQTPLAIYVPSEQVELWQIGRKDYKMKRLIEKHKDILLDMHRSYAVIYEWIEGIDAVQAVKENIIKEEDMATLAVDADRKLREKGFFVKDNKPHHIIISPEKDGSFDFYGLVDFELLQRTPEKQNIVKKEKRHDYLLRQRDRFNKKVDFFHPHLKSVKIMGIDYIYGHVESTKGRLWVVGKDPYLFDYFLPERWEKTPKTKISLYNNMYYTVTKDGIHIVWKLSKVGTQPDMDIFKEDERKILEYGYNSPFEEFSLAVELDRKGFPTTYPRAIYMAEQKSEILDALSDDSRYKTHSKIKTPDGLPVLMRNRDYILIWGYWNGPDEKLAAKDDDYYKGIDALRAYRNGIISETLYFDLLKEAKRRLLNCGVEDLNLRGSHILISLTSKGEIIKDETGMPEMRLCNFEFLRKINK